MLSTLTECLTAHFQLCSNVLVKYSYLLSILYLHITIIVTRSCIRRLQVVVTVKFTFTGFFITFIDLYSVGNTVLSCSVPVGYHSPFFPSYSSRCRGSAFQSYSSRCRESAFPSSCRRCGSAFRSSSSRCRRSAFQSYSSRCRGSAFQSSSSRCRGSAFQSYSSRCRGSAFQSSSSRGLRRPWDSHRQYTVLIASFTQLSIIAFYCNIHNLFLKN